MKHEKQYIIENLTKELESILSQLSKVKKNTKDYEELQLKKELISKKLEIVKQMDDINIFDKLSELEKVKNNYSFLSELTNEEKEMLIYLLYSNKKEAKALNETKAVDLDIIEELPEYKSVLEENGLNYKEIDSLNYKDKVLKLITEKYKRFEFAVERFKKGTKNLDINEYYSFKRRLDNPKDYVTSKYLGDFSKLVEPALVIKIKDLEKEMFVKTRDALSQTKKTQIHEEYRKRIERYMNKLMDEVKHYYKTMFSMYSEQINIDVDLDKEFIQIYEKINREIKEKRSNIKSLIVRLKDATNVYTLFEKEFNDKIEKNKIALEDENIEIIRNMSVSELQNIIAQIDIYDTINRDYQPGDNGGKKNT